jgi:CRISPR-associated exonuclease Cas4
VDGDPIPISAIQHAVYCFRQTALIHIERMWKENRLTAEGCVLHATTDKLGAHYSRGVLRYAAIPAPAPPRRPRRPPISTGR